MNFELTILGSSSGAPTIDRYQTSQHLVIQNQQFLIDCGEATQNQLIRYGLGYMRINHIFISHLHADHYIGLIGLINTMNLNHREQPLFIHCPKGLDEIISVQLKYSGAVLSFRLHFVFTDTESVNCIFRDEHVSVISIPLVHRLPVTGFLFRETDFPRTIKKDMIQKYQIPFEAFKLLKKGEDYMDSTGKVFSWEELTEKPPNPRSYAFITDTIYHPAIVPVIRGADLLYHEATFMEDQVGYSADRFHSTNIEAARIAKESGVKKLIIGHFSTRYKDLDILLNQAREIFRETYLANEGVRFEIPYGKKIHDIQVHENGTH